MTDDFEREAAAGAQGETPAAEREQAFEADILRDELRLAQERLEKLQSEADEARDRYLRARAEFENYRRRMGEELEREREAGMDSMVLPVLNVYDDLERALEAAATAGEEGPFVLGVRAVRDSLLRQLAGLGVTVVGLPGDEFDPEIHEALATVPAGPEAAAGTIAHVYSAGFTKGERLIRPAKVIVAKEGA